MRYSGTAAAAGLRAPRLQPTPRHARARGAGLPALHLRARDQRGRQPSATALPCTNCDGYSLFGISYLQIFAGMPTG
jgi:hypothetical protein